ncbi:hypothetical protein HDE_09758 [Halotydeus destructor]|nr:hypothetical protein HDE_09758 [Halotydeus destructor]
MRKIIHLFALFSLCALCRSRSIRDSQNSRNEEEYKEWIARAENENGVLDPVKLVAKYLADPMTISDFNVTESGRMTNFAVNLKRMSLKGLRGLDIESMKFNLGWMHVDVVMTLPTLRLEGDYRMGGQIMLVPIVGRGPFFMDITGLKIFAKAALKSSPSGLQVGEMVLDLEVDDLDMHFSNLMGSGKWSSLTNGLLNKMSHLIFDHVKYMLLDELKADIHDHLNTQLAKLPDQFVTKRSENLFDDLLSRVAEAVTQAGFDPLRLPNQVDGFDHDLGLFRFRGHAQVHNGVLHGLKTLIRTGDVIAIYENDSVTLEANLGFENLTGSYDWRASFMGPGMGGSSTLHVSCIQVFVKLRQGLKRGDRPLLDTFEVRNFKNIWIDLTGLGTVDFIVEAIVNLVTNTFKAILANFISGPIRNLLQEKLDQVPITFFQ